MKLKVLKYFNDAVEGKLRKPGEAFEADAERAEELLAHPLKLVEKAERATAGKGAAKKVETADKRPVVKRAKKPAAKK